MKNSLLVVVFLLGCIGYSQGSLTKEAYRKRLDSWVLSVGVNMLGSLGTQNPVERLDEFSFKNPLMVGIEFRWLDFLSFEQDIILNGFDEGQFLDNGILTEDIFYFATNSNLKFYFSDYIYDADWVDLYIGTGIGIFTIDEFNTAANVMGGVNFWVNRTRTIGVKIQGAGKFAFNNNNRQFDNNHWVHSLQVTFRL
ncbi:MAG: hypothetical protein AAF688_13350 [Bacteroidota bacterium]